MGKKIVLTVVSYMLISSGLAYPWHFIWFKDYIHDLGIYTREQPIIPLGILSMFLQGSIMAYFYPKLYKGGDPILKGIKFSLIMGIFLFSVSTIANAAKIDVTSISSFVGIQAIFHFIQFFIFGIALGMIHGKKR